MWTMMIPTTLFLCCLSGLLDTEVVVNALAPPIQLSAHHASITSTLWSTHRHQATTTTDLNVKPFRRRPTRQQCSSRSLHILGAESNADASNTGSTSLFAKRPSYKRKLAIPALMLFILRRISPAFVSGRVMSLRRIISILFSVDTLRSIFMYFRKLNRQKVKTILLVGLAILAFKTLIEGIQATQRQKIDATSEWGRYADKPAARGVALTILMMRLMPYVIAPKLIEKITGKKRDGDDYGLYNTKEEYESSISHRLRKQGGKLFANGLLRLGPLYIKIGQILSCRENLFPEEWIGGMERLQDRVPAKSREEAWKLAYEACPGGRAGFHQTFIAFNDIPLAAASLGQVHKARLRSTGEAVAIKIQRPKLREIYDKDLVFLKKIAKVVDSFGKAGQVGGVEQSWVDIFDDAETILYREIDYRDEAENAIRFANDFGIGLGGEAVDVTACSVEGKKLSSAAEWLRTPYTYEDLSSEKFLVMEYVPSIKVSNNAKLDEAGITVEDREYLAEALAHAYLRQFCVNKFFSTDPHPGNLGVEVFDDDRAPRMVFYDFGQACSLSDDQAGGILEVIESIIDSDAKRSVKAFVRMGVLKDNADLKKVQAKCQQNYDEGKLKVKKRKKRGSWRYTTGLFSDNTELDARIDQAEKPSNSTTSKVEVKDTEVMEYFQLQSEYAFVARALSQMDGVGKGLDPDFDFISAAAPYLVDVKGTGRYLLDEARKKLKFVYDPTDPDSGILGAQRAFIRSLGFKMQWDDDAADVTEE